MSCYAMLGCVFLGYVMYANMHVLVLMCMCTQHTWMYTCMYACLSIMHDIHMRMCYEHKTIAFSCGILTPSLSHVHLS